MFPIEEGSESAFMINRFFHFILIPVCIKKAFSLNLHFPLIFFSFLKRQSKRSGLVFLLLGCVFQTNFTGAKTLDECRELWKTPQEIKSCVLLRGVSEKSRYQEVLKTPDRPYGYQSFKFGTLREKLEDGQTHLILSVELMVTHPAFQYLIIRDITAERLIRTCMRQANPKKPVPAKIKGCILEQMRGFFNQNYRWKKEPIWDVGLLKYQVELQKREKLRNR